MEIDSAAPAITLPMERPLYTPVRKPRVDSKDICRAGRRRGDRPAALFEQAYVDPGPLRGRRPPGAAPHRAGRPRRARRRLPLAQGLAELVAYLSLRDEAFTLVFDEASHERVSWTEPDGRGSTATCRVSLPPGGHPGGADHPARLSLAVTQLIKGVVYRDTHDRAWRSCCSCSPRWDYVAVLGLQVVIDEAEGYAFLRSAPTRTSSAQLPRLVPRRRCPSTSACCSRCCARSSPSSTPRAATRG